MLGMDLHSKRADCNHGYTDLPTENFPTQIKMEIDAVGEEMTSSNDKGEITQGKVMLQQSPCHSDVIVIIPNARNQSGRVDVVTPKTKLREIHSTSQKDNSSVEIKCKLDPETQSVISCPEPSSVRDDIEHPRYLSYVKQEVLDTDDCKALVACCSHGQNIDHSSHSCEDRKPAIENSSSLNTHCLMQSHDSSTSPELMPVGLYYNTVHLRHLVKSEVTESQQEIDIGVEERENDTDHTGAMEADSPVREFLHATGRVDNRGQTIVNDTVCDPDNDLFSDHKVPACGEEMLHIRDHGDHRGQNNPVNDLFIPKPIHNDGKAYICKFCSKAFSQSSGLKLHERVHTGEKPYTCNICNKAFSDSSYLKKHQRTHTGEKPYTCKFCSKAFSQSHSLQIHKRAHTGEKPYTCNICKKAFSQSHSLQIHKRAHTGEKPYTCSICKKAFSQSHSLQIHKRAHTGEKPYTCNICKKAFSESGDLKKHQRKHTGEKPYACKFCSKAFSQLNSLKTHERAHTGQKPYTCNICNKAFSHLSNLKQHERTHTGEKPYTCNICNKTFSHLSNLKRHERTHTGEKPYACT